VGFWFFFVIYQCSFIPCSLSTARIIFVIPAEVTLPHGQGLGIEFIISKW